jgi:putative ABC transport system permease protein
MSHIRLVIQSLLKQGKTPWLMVIQMFIGFFCLILGFGLLEETYRTINKAKKEIPASVIRLQFAGGPIGQAHLERSDVIEQLKKISGIKYMGTSMIVWMNFNELSDAPEYGDTPTYFVDEDFIKMYDIDVKAGRKLTGQDAQESGNKEIPVIVGYELGKLAPINTVLTTGNRHFIVAGVLPDSYKFWQKDNLDLSSRITDEPWMILAPRADIKPTEGSMFLWYEGEDISSAIVQIEKEISKLGYKGIVYDLEKQIQVYISRNKPIIQATLAISGLLLILSSLGIMGVTLASIVRRQKEFGLRYALGASSKSLLGLVLGEIIIIVLVSSILGLVFVKVFQLLMDELDFTFSIVTYLLTGGTIFISTLSIVILPLRYASRLNPIQLLRGEK